MPLKATFYKKTFFFSFQARTSRGSMKHRDSWFLKVWDSAAPEVCGWGEAGPLPGLSDEKPHDVEKELEAVCERISGVSDLRALGSLQGISDWLQPLEVHSSVRLSVESALLSLFHGGKQVVFDNDFAKGKPIPINGLVWMGGLDYMLQQVSIKLEEGFSCIKVKIGGINFEKELDILQFIRRKYFRDQISIRLDANGSFKPDQAMYKLIDCSRFDVHSIEQPLKAGSAFLPELCRDSPIPVALDEELIGMNSRQQKSELLERVRPSFLVLKPSLHGGFAGCDEWISLAKSMQIGWWVTSSLESTIGLNAVAQFAASHPNELHQGLGTGTIYENNIPSPLEVKKGFLTYDSQGIWDFSDIG